MQDPQLLNSIARGRIYVAIAIAVTLLGDAVVILLKMSAKGIGPSIPGVLRWFITLALLLAVWRGRVWACRLTVALMSIGLSLTIPALVSTWHPLVIAIFMQFLVAVVLLSFPPATSNFLATQRLRS